MFFRIRRKQFKKRKTGATNYIIYYILKWKEMIRTIKRTWFLKITKNQKVQFVGSDGSHGWEFSGEENESGSHSFEARYF